MGIGSAHAAWRHTSPSRAAKWMRGLTHAVWEYVRMRTTHAVWGAGMRMNYMGMRMSGATISMANGR